MDKKKRKQIGKRSRTKGHSFEREISSKLRSVFPNARRLLEYHPADANGVDIQNTENFKFQCKRLKNYASINTIDEINCDSFLGEVPVLVTQADHKKIMAVLPFDDFLILLQKAIKNSQRLTKKINYCLVCNLHREGKLNGPLEKYVHQNGCTYYVGF